MSFVQENFWGLSASLLGAYEAISYVTRLTPRPLPTVSNWCSRKRHRRTAVLVWTVGLGLHLYRHTSDTLPPSCS